MEQNRSFLPSRQFVLVVGSVLVVVVLVFVARLYGSQGETAEYRAEVVTTTRVNTPTTFTEKDSDGDGLMDWEEGLWGTDPNNPNSKSVSVNDAEYVATVREALKAPSQPTQTAQVKQTLTETDILARDLFTQYLNIKGAGSNITSDVAQGLAATLANSVLTETEPSTIYTSADLNIVDDSERAYENYEKLLEATINQYQGAGGIDEIVELQKAIENPGNVESVMALETAWKQYENVLQDMLDLPVPSGVVSEHLEMVNALSVLVNNVESFQYVLADPVVALPAISNYGLNLQLFYEKLLSLGNSVESNISS